MTVFIALLRAVNLGGDTQVSMADLREQVARLGFRNVQSLLQSGNLVFEGAARSAGSIESTLNSELAPRLPARTEFFVRTAQEWEGLIEKNPFPREAEADPSRFVLSVLRESPPPLAWKTLQAAIPGRERVEGVGRQAYLIYPDGQGRSKVTPAFLEARLGTRCTNRNWNTVRKLERLATA